MKTTDEIVALWQDFDDLFGLLLHNAVPARTQWINFINGVPKDG